MADVPAEPVVGRLGTYELGRGRPPLAVDDLPTPEEVFDIPRATFGKTVRYIVGPSLIALGLSVGSGEWLLGPQAVGEFGWVGIGFVILLSIILQGFYNMEVGRYVMATGEVPSLGFGRVLPFYVGTILAIALFYAAFITGGWASGAGSSLFTAVTGDIPGPEDLRTTQWLGVLLMGVVFVIVLFGRKISRTLELVNWVLVAFVLLTVFLVAVFLAPASAWLDGIEGLFRPALPPDDVDATTLGAVAGFAAMASGLNYVFMNYYRDKGYGMGSRAGYIPGLLAPAETRRVEIDPVGTTFRETEENARRWTRWFNYLQVEMFVIFVPGAIIGILFPSILVHHLARETGNVPTRENMPTYLAGQIEATGEPRIFFGWALLVGFIILFTTQMVVFEMLTRNMVDALYGSSASFRRLLGGDPRRFYYPFMVVLGIVISFIIFQGVAVELLQWAANMSNLAALIMPFLIMYLISQLPRPARATWWSYVILAVVAVFFGFFFLNFFVSQLTGGETDLSFWR